MNLTERYLEIRKSIQSDIQIVAVSKYKPAENIERLFKDCGQVIFGENKAQEMVDKALKIKVPVEWHFIGHLQSNKIRMILPHVSLIQSIDSAKLLEAVNKEAKRINKTIPCLIQFYIAQEESKFGFTYDEFSSYFKSGKLKELKNIEIRGIMGMATYTDNQSQIRAEFRNLKGIFNSLKINYFNADASFSEISMGMSDDYKIAIEEGSTMVRIGSGIFGSR